MQIQTEKTGRLAELAVQLAQATAKAAEARRAQEIRRIDAALERLDNGEYGWCVECGETIEARRLEIDPATPRCAGCA